MVELPQFNAPFSLNADGTVDVVEQGTPAEIAAGVFNVVCCPVGARVDDPDFGLDAPLFSAIPVDLAELLSEVRTQEPRATQYSIQDIATVLDQARGVETVVITAAVVDDGQVVGQ